MSKLVLVVDDESKITDVVADYLRASGFAVETAADGPSALARSRARPPDLVVLDLGLPGADGLDVARELRRGSSVPIIMLTARGAETDRIVGLEIGADDYIVKPFSPRELVARVRAVLRRVDGVPTKAERFTVGDAVFDLARREVTIAGRVVGLTATEFDLLVEFARQPGRVFTRAQLMDALHGVDVDSYDRTIDAHVKNIRRKLEPQPRTPRYLLTVHGVGYRFVEGT
ncbi:response regulator transcription factor [Desertimonas flava]|uniref:response regulator transcription factor n=1 Tax=Desertimonas flava TaxID=2064846 RepID=UPI000E353038|nr:response regulator transcription factor [Desertimonas flava]